MPDPELPGEAIIGLEVIKLGDIDDDSPWRMTVDAVKDGRIVRYQVTGHYNGWPTGPPERTLDELARVQTDFARRDAIAAELDRLDREFAVKVAPLMRDLQRAQILLIHGQKTLDWLDRSEAEQ